MSDYDLACVPDLLARLDDDPDYASFEYSLGRFKVKECIKRALDQEREESAAAIRALLESRDDAERAASHAETKIKLAVEVEREACARVCDDCAAHAMASYSGDLPSVVGGELHWAAQEIRSRGDA